MDAEILLPKNIVNLEHFNWVEEERKEEFNLKL